MVYFVRDGDYVRFEYVQSQQRLERRLANLQCGNPHPLDLEAVVEGAGPRSADRLHRSLAPYRKPGGDWFRLTPQQVLKAASEIA